jgi:hypothetical protein
VNNFLYEVQILLKRFDGVQEVGEFALVNVIHIGAGACGLLLPIFARTSISLRHLSTPFLETP